MDLATHLGNAGGVDPAQVAQALDRHGATHADLAAAMYLEDRVGDALDGDAVQAPEFVQDRFELHHRWERELEVADAGVGSRRDLADVAEVGAGPADDLDDPP